MKTKLAKIFRTRVGMMLLEFVVTSLICGVGMASANGNDRNKHMDKHNNGHYDNRGNGHHGRREYRSHEYRERGYLPPPVFYAPPPPPGIGIFFPPIIFHH
jgi:hypothetical protein